MALDLKGAFVKLAKLLLHGLPFALPSFGLGFLWGSFPPSMGTNLEALILIPILVGLSVIWGLVNTIVAGLLWFPMRKKYRAFLAQGTILGPSFLLVNVLPVFALVALFNELGLMEQMLTVVLVNLLYVALDGYIAKSVAAHWRVLGVQAEMTAKAAALVNEPEIKPDNPEALRCPRCGGVNLVVASDRSAYCLDCKRGLRSEVMGGAAS